MASERSRITPPALQAGDTVGIVAPASSFRREDLEAGCEALRQLGYKPYYLDSIFDHDLYFAGSAARRARELEGMFARDEVRAIVCVRGGYGSNYLLEHLDVRQIISRPKIFVGYSDLTTLLTWLADAGLVTFHGPMVAKDFARAEGVDRRSWELVLGGVSGLDLALDSGARPLVEGSAEGRLYGGCLSILAASLGTPYAIQTRDTILFIEDVAAKPYQIDRMLMQLKLGGKLDGIRGIIFGEMLDCAQNPDQPPALEEVLAPLVGSLGVPVAYGFRSGHVSRSNITVPFGVRADLKVTASGVSLKLREAAASATAPRRGDAVKRMIKAQKS